MSESNEPMFEISLGRPAEGPGSTLPGSAKAEITDRFEAWLKTACQVPFAWVLADGRTVPIDLKQVIRANYSMTERHVCLRVTFQSRALNHEIDAAASDSLNRLKRQWTVRGKILLARLMGQDTDQLDEMNRQQIAERIRVCLAHLVVQEVGTRLVAQLMPRMMLHSEGGCGDPRATQNSAAG